MLFFVDGAASAGMAIQQPHRWLVSTLCLHLLGPKFFVRLPPNPPLSERVALIFKTDRSRTAGEIINSLRLSEARQLLSQYKKHRENGAAVAAAASLSAIDLKGFLSGEAEEGVRGVFAEEEAPTAGGAAGGSTTAIRTEQKLMTLVEKAVMALTQVCACASLYFCLLYQQMLKQKLEACCLRNRSYGRNGSNAPVPVRCKLGEDIQQIADSSVKKEVVPFKRSPHV